MIRQYTTQEIDDAAKEWLDDEEKYKLWLENRDEYLEFREELKRMCEEDKPLVEGVVMQLQEILEGMRDMKDKPGWEVLCYEIEIRNFQCEFLDGTYIENPDIFQHYPVMKDTEMAQKTGLSRERVVQETKRCARKLGQKLKQQGFGPGDFLRSSNDNWEEN